MVIFGATDSNQKQQGHIDTPPPETLDERRRRWVHLLRTQHYEPVIIDLLSEELPKYVNSCVVDPADMVMHTRECALILASASRIFFAAVEGNLVSLMDQDTNLQAEYAFIQQRACHQPSIYIHVLTDDEGNAPTPNQYLIIRNTIQDYRSQEDSGLAYNIDNITPPLVSLEASTQGYRKYLHTLRTDRSPGRIAILQRLCTGITLRCSQIPSQSKNTPLQHPPAEVGYALHAHQRLAQHRAHRSSNYVMNLVEDICTHLFRTDVLTQHFKMHQYVIYLIFRPSQAAIAEIFCSGLLQCWVDGGGGFNAYPAGRSIASSKRVSVDEWREHEAVTRLISPLGERMSAMKERADIWRKALNCDDEDDDEQTVEINAGEAKEDRDSMNMS